jgi:hypothetical protein
VRKITGSLFDTRRDQLEAVHVRHGDVADDEVGRRLEHRVAGGDGVLGHLDGIAGRGKVQAQQFAHRLVVFHHQDAGRVHSFGIMMPFRPLTQP